MLIPCPQPGRGGGTGTVTDCIQLYCMSDQDGVERSVFEVVEMEDYNGEKDGQDIHDGYRECGFPHATADGIHTNNLEHYSYIRYQRINKIRYQSAYHKQGCHGPD